MTLGIETSCDETAASVVAGAQEIRSSIIASQFVHSRFGGVVPELASRAHIRLVVPVVQSALDAANARLTDVDLVAVTCTPGLLGALLVGLPFAKAFAWSRQIPFVGVNHLEGHVFAVFLQYPAIPLPFICLIVSGGHTELILVKDRCRYQTLGATLDDACGEAFDKAAKMLGLPYPGGMFIEEHARQGLATLAKGLATLAKGSATLAKGSATLAKGSCSIRFPLPRVAGLDFSFSGLKTALLYYLRDQAKGLKPQASSFQQQGQQIANLDDICCSFQEALVEALLAKVAQAVEETGIRHVAVTGGVAVNNRLRERLLWFGQTRGFEVFFPDRSLCTDNAAMIAACGYARFQRFGPAPWSLPALARQTLD